MFASLSCLSVCLPACQSVCLSVRTSFLLPVHLQANGVGKFAHENGDVYDGEWKNDKAHGQGASSPVEGFSRFFNEKDRQTDRQKNRS